MDQVKVQLMAFLKSFSHYSAYYKKYFLQFQESNRTAKVVTLLEHPSIRYPNSAADITIVLNRKLKTPMRKEYNQ